jgi:hypothetical protein
MAFYGDIGKYAKMGAQTKYHDKMPGMLLDMLSQGKTLSQFCAKNKISESTFHRFRSQHEELQDAYDIAKTARKGTWEGWLADNLCNKDANAPLVKMYFSNTLGYADKSEVSQDTFQVDTVMKELTEARQVYEKACKREY